MKKFIPRKFRYEEFHYFREGFLVEWTSRGLEIQRTSACIPFLIHSDVVLKKSLEDFEDFISKVENLDLNPTDPEDLMCDGFEVQCHITFYRTLIKFDIVNPDFANFEKFRELINEFTVCEEFPFGLFYEEEDEVD